MQGHTDNVGSAELNRQFSQQRAEAVCLYLAAHGVGPAQLRPMGYGGTQPVADNADPTQRPPQPPRSAAPPLSRRRAAAEPTGK